MTKLKNIYLIYFLLFTQMQSFLYLSIYIYEIDDCINKIFSKEENEIYFENDININCKYEDLTYYPNDGNPIIKNIIYILGKTIIIQIYNKSKMISKCYINMKVKINEYFIGLSNNNNIWNCNECEYNINLDKISDLKNEESVEVDKTFYAFTSQMNFNYSIDYKNDELELINFNISNNFYIKSNKSLLVNFTNYKFKINYRVNLMEH